MASISFLDRFPFCVLPAQEWDGATVYTRAPVGYVPTTVPSASSESYSPVFGEGTHYPVGFTLEEVIELYWRIAVWEVVLTSNIGGTNSTLTFPLYIGTVGRYAQFFYQGLETGEDGGVVTPADSQVPSYNFTNEREERILICGSEPTLEGEFDYASTGYQYAEFGFFFSPDGVYNQDGTFEAEAGTITQEATGTLILAEGIPDLAPISRVEHVVSVDSSLTFVELRIDMFQGVAAMEELPPILFDESSGLYYPQFSFAIGVDLGFGGVWSSTKPDTSENPVGTVDFFGKPVNVYGPSFSNLTLAITPKYWWPYDGGSGPIYDVNTGSPL